MKVPTLDSHVCADDLPKAIAADQQPPGGEGPGTALHRIRTVRWQQGFTLKTVARRTGLRIRDVQQLERSENDLSLSLLYRFQQALEVPVSHLLVDTDDSLSEPVRLRALLIKAMKSVASIQQECEQDSVQLLAQNLRETLIELMPELEEVQPWPSVGQSRETQASSAPVQHFPEHSLQKMFA